MQVIYHHSLVYLLGNKVDQRYQPGDEAAEKLIADNPVLFPSKNFGAIVMQGVYYTLASIRQGCLIQT